jgi:cytochrome c553
MKKEMKFAGKLLTNLLAKRLTTPLTTRLGKLESGLAFVAQPALSLVAAGGLGFLASMGAFMGTAYAETPGEKDAKYGKTPVAMCIGCHGIEGYKASFPNVYLVPKISGQSQKYLESALQAYRKGDRSHPSMKAIAGSLTDADITALAAYYSKNASTDAAK